jgi:hypothetical protein
VILAILDLPLALQVPSSTMMGRIMGRLGNPETDGDAHPLMMATVLS